MNYALHQASPTACIQCTDNTTKHSFKAMSVLYFVNFWTVTVLVVFVPSAGSWRFMLALFSNIVEQDMSLLSESNLCDQYSSSHANPTGVARCIEVIVKVF